MAKTQRKYDKVIEELDDPAMRDLLRDEFHSVVRRGWTVPDDVTGMFLGKRGPAFDLSTMDRLIKGSIDINCHPAPCAVANRPFDGAELGIEATKEGMEAICFQSLSVPTSMSVYYIQQIVDRWAKDHGVKPTRIIGGVTLSHEVGGMNPHVVDAEAKLGGKIVWMPVVDASWALDITGQPGGIAVLDENDNVLPGLMECLEVMKQYDLVLVLGSQSTRERLIITDAAKAMGVEKIVAVHVTQPSTKVSLENMKLLADKGVYLEHDCWDMHPPLADWNEIIPAMKTIGVERFVLGSDLGSWPMPPPVATFKRFLGLLVDRGIDESEVEVMKANAHGLFF